MYVKFSGQLITFVQSQLYNPHNMMPLCHASRTAITALIIITTSSGAPQSSCQSTDALTGKCGAELKEAINHTERPSRLATPDELQKLLPHIGPDADNGVTDRVLPLDWWKNTTPDYGDTAGLDMHQMFICQAGFPAIKKDYPPGLVITPTYSDDIWTVGYGVISGEQVWTYTPPTEFRGDFARAIFYMATMYPVKMWNGLGINLFGDNTYPTLNRHSTTLLLQWNSDDPVDQSERQHNQTALDIQGNRNPFVDAPDLAEHIWGKKSQLPWNDTEAEPRPEQPTYTVKELSAAYQLTDTVYLHSPYVPAHASWRINGTTVDYDRITAASLGTGIHELRFSSPEISGKLKITVK